MIETLSFSDGSDVKLSRLTIIVGPNNGGKSRALRDIEAVVTNNIHHRPQVVTGARLILPSTLEEAVKLSGFRYTEKGLDGFRVEGLASSMSEPFARDNLSKKAVVDIFSAAASAAQRTQQILSIFGQGFVMRLGTEERLAISSLKQVAPAGAPTSLIDLLFRGGANAERSLASAILQAFPSSYLRLDYSTQSRVTLRVGDSDILTVSIDPREQVLDFEPFSMLESQGDGLRSYAALCLGLDIAKRPVTLIDEPETFLHPPQIQALGRYIHESGSQQIIISTHSVDLVQSIAHASSEATIIRLTRTENVNHARVVSPSRLEDLISDPLVSSARCLDAMFYRGAVITEGDSDRLLYQRVYDRQFRGDDIHFLNAQSKQTIHKIARAYNEMGVPCAAIVDFDILNDARTFTELLNALSIEGSSREKAIALRARIAGDIEGPGKLEERRASYVKQVETTQRRIDSTTDVQAQMQDLSDLGDKLRFANDPWLDAKRNGAGALQDDSSVAFFELCDIVERSGLFIVPVGELEGWLHDAVSTSRKNKANWLAASLKALPHLLTEPTDVWAFIARVREYLIGQSN
ncbi:MAG TPA: AAA family ATPase [Candidatus Tumulicola sp.]